MIEHKSVHNDSYKYNVKFNWSNFRILFSKKDFLFVCCLLSNFLFSSTKTGYTHSFSLYLHLLESLLCSGRKEISNYVTIWYIDF